VEALANTSHAIADYFHAIADYFHAKKGTKHPCYLQNIF
jgi:hypothetical protein